MLDDICLLYILKSKLTEEQYVQKLAQYREKQKQKEQGGPSGMEPTRYDTWEHKGKEVDF